jgi:hypothetical protein
MNLLDNYLCLRITEGKKIALVIDFAETRWRPLEHAGRRPQLSGHPETLGDGPGALAGGRLHLPDCRESG